MTGGPVKEVNGSAPWWTGDGLACDAKGLTFGGQSVAELARAHGTPLYIYSRQILRARLARLREVLAAVGVPTRAYYAMKANRFEPLLRVIRGEGDVGIDACSPREVALALEMGFRPDEISVTASMLSNRDFDAFAGFGVQLNLDSHSALRRWGARVPPGTRVGLRMDAGIDVGYGASQKVAYGNTKFGFEHSALDSALEAARSAGLEVAALHVHCGWGMQMPALGPARVGLRAARRVLRVASRRWSWSTWEVVSCLAGRVATIR